MSGLNDIPEIRALENRRNLVRIPCEIDAPLTPRVRRLIDTGAFRRLSQITQLGLVSQVYPGATHSRFEHSLGVYRMSLLYLQQLSHDERFAASVDSHSAEVFITAALLHDIGHWPFCHPIEDLRIEGVPRHEFLARTFLQKSEAEGGLACALRQDWGIEPDEIAGLLSSETTTLAGRILQSLLSGPVDIDKMDYLPRDSLHAGVPYGRNFDQQRLIGSLCLNAAGDGLAVLDKGRTAAEMMVFARYVMFSEVYWHHTVRSATAMLQRAFYMLAPQLQLERVLAMVELPWVQTLRAAAAAEETPDGSASPAATLMDGLFGPKRLIYKRLSQYSYFQNRELYGQLARRGYPWLTRCGDNLSKLLSAELKTEVKPHEVLFDAPPVKLEVECNVDIYFPKEDQHRGLADVSPVVHTLANKQFDDFVKCVRVFVAPALLPAARGVSNLNTLVKRAIEMTS